MAKKQQTTSQQAWEAYIAAQAVSDAAYADYERQRMKAWDRYQASYARLKPLQDDWLAAMRRERESCQTTTAEAESVTQSNDSQTRKRRRRNEKNLYPSNP